MGTRESDESERIGAATRRFKRLGRGGLGHSLLYILHATTTTTTTTTIVIILEHID
jgi:hypothetical protein